MAAVASPSRPQATFASFLSRPCFSSCSLKGASHFPEAFLFIPFLLPGVTLFYCSGSLRRFLMGDGCSLVDLPPLLSSRYAPDDPTMRGQGRQQGRLSRVAMMHSATHTAPWRLAHLYLLLLIPPPHGASSLPPLISPILLARLWRLPLDSIIRKPSPLVLTIRLVCVGGYLILVSL